MQSISVLLDITKVTNFWISVEKILVSTEFNGRFFRLGITVPSFIIVGYV